MSPASDTLSNTEARVNDSYRLVIWFYWGWWFAAIRGAVPSIGAAELTVELCWRSPTLSRMKLGPDYTPLPGTHSEAALLHVGPLTLALEHW